MTISMNHPLSDAETPAWFVSAALDEIYALRVALAYEAQLLEGTLDIKSLPVTVRKNTERAVKAMREAAAGSVEHAYSDIPRARLHFPYREVNGTNLMTRYMWEQQRLGRAS